MAELDKYFSDLIAKVRPLAKDLRESEQRIVGLLLAGNAGGAAVALTIIGGMIGTSENLAIPSALFWILVCFLVGLLAIWASRWTEILFASARLDQAWAEHDEKVVKRMGRRLTLHTHMGRAAYIVSSATALGGVTWGMFFLYRLTVPDS